MWRERSALKMWVGWPTFPMVFVEGTFVGGASDLITLLDAGDRDGVFRCSLRARDLAAFRERFPAYHDGDEFELKL